MSNIELPTWLECSEIMDEEINPQDVEFPRYGVPTQLHKFIYEYDDADPVRSDIFMNMLKLLIEEIKTGRVTNE